jgi:hypothetical protein
MELKELIAAFIGHLDKDEFCKNQPTDPKQWKARINDGVGKAGTCSAKRLYSALKTAGEKVPPDFGYLGPPTAYVAKQGKGFKWWIAKVKPHMFPIQAHHIIPKNYLPEQPVCTFLAQNYKKHKKYQLTGDTPYDNDHANNGYCMPYATPMAEWKDAGSNESLKLDICYQVMEEAQRQLHQGSHRARPYEEDPSDPDEEAKIHPTGYLNTVKRYLALVSDAASNHVETCSTCKQDSSGEKTKIQPIEATVRHVDQVSGIIKLLIDANRIFVSEPADLYYKSKKKPLVRPHWLK